MEGLLEHINSLTEDPDYDLHGTIGPTPWLETEEGQQTILDLVTGSAGGGIAGSIRGGKPLNLFAGYSKKSQEIIKRWLKDGYDTSQGGMTKAAFDKWKKLKDIWNYKQTGKVLDDVQDDIVFKNKLSKAKIQNQKTLEKHKIDDPDFEEYASPANYLLDAMRNLKRN